MIVFAGKITEKKPTLSHREALTREVEKELRGCRREREERKREGDRGKREEIG